MQLNLTSDYGLRIVLYLAQKGSVTSSAEICTKMGIPPSYMHKLAKVLKNIGAIREIRGSAGGFVLKKAPENLSVLTILNAFEKTMDINKRLEKNTLYNIDVRSYYAVRELYAEIQAELNKKFDIKISTLLEK
jgi:Rrf2 family nitric oxide-sensitive transcriptional repressor